MSKRLEKMSLRDALVTGVFQTCAVLPGISRSGATVTGMLWQDYERSDAVKFSFVMSLPAVIGACILESGRLADTFSADGSSIAIYLSGAFAAAITGMLSIKLLSYISKKSNFRIFSRYCALLGAAAVLISLVQKM